MPSQRRGVLVGLLLVLAFAALVVGANVAVGDESRASMESIESIATATVTPVATAAPVTEWPHNDAGLTYGSDAVSKSAWDDPDLIAVVATNGERGYIYQRDALNELPTTEELKATPEKIWLVPVYKEDGVTKVGVFRTGWAPANQSPIE
jgi:hypothetical protein